MEEIIEKIGWKKFAIGLIGVSLLGLVYVIFSFSSLDKSANSASSARQGQDSIPIITNSNNSNYEVNKTPSSSETVVLGKTFITPYYQISYPEIYAPTLYAEQEGVLNGLLLSDALGDSRVEISVFDNKATTIARLSEIPISLGLTKGQTNVGQYLGESYSGVSPGMKVYEKIVLIRKENVIIKFQLMQLTGPTKEGQTEFESILQSFQ